MSFLVVAVCLNLGRKIKCFYFVSAYIEKVSFRIKGETLRDLNYLSSGNVALRTFAVTLDLQSDIFYSTSPM